MYSKGNLQSGKARVSYRFNSLQTGKCIQSNRFELPTECKHHKFQFPSNGKVYSKGCIVVNYNPGPNSFNSLQTGKCIQSTIYVYACPKGRHRVSIPFKRESVFKAMLQKSTSSWSKTSFNSLQTGKCIQSRECFVGRLRN